MCSVGQTVEQSKSETTKSSLQPALLKLNHSFHPTDCPVLRREGCHGRRGQAAQLVLRLSHVRGRTHHRRSQPRLRPLRRTGRLVGRSVGFLS